MTTDDDQRQRLTELRGKLAGLCWCDHEADICTGACDIIDEIGKLEGQEGAERP